MSKTLSERLTKDIHFATFRVDDSGLDRFELAFNKDFHQKTAELANLGLYKFNSTKTVSEWFQSISNGKIDTSRGVGKDVYLKPEYLAAYPQLSVFAEVKRLESLRRKLKTFRFNLAD